MTRFFTLLTIAVAQLALKELPAQAASGGARPAQVGVPATLEQALAALDSILPDSVKGAIRDSSDRYQASLHMGLGLWMRNSWGLWGNSALRRDLVGRGLQHPDDMSGVILASYRAKLRGEHFDLEAAVRSAAEYWRVTAEPTPLQFPGCTGGVEIRGGTGADPEPGRLHRFIHVATCKADGVWWAYEIDRGWFKPDSALVSFWKNPRPPGKW